VREHGKIPNAPAALKALAVKLSHAGPHATTHPMLGHARGTVTARRTLEGIISRILSDAGH
jgi:hypothetical protein